MKKALLLAFLVASSSATLSADWGRHGGGDRFDRGDSLRFNRGYYADRGYGDSGYNNRNFYGNQDYDNRYMNYQNDDASVPQCSAPDQRLSDSDRAERRAMIRDRVNEFRENTTDAERAERRELIKDRINEIRDNNN